MSAKARGFILTTLIGNLIEWYDLALYGYFAPVIANLFFPSTSTVTSLLMTFGVFAIGFLARPLGGIFFGYVGDIYGRKTALLISIFLIIFPTFFIGILPTYQHIGLLAPILLTALRILQGVAISGELISGAIFLLENVETHKRGRYASYIMCSTYVGLAIGAFISMIVYWLFSPLQILDYAWRLPFLLSLFFGVIAAWMRIQCHESPFYQQLVEKNLLSKTPLREMLKYHSYPLFLSWIISSNLAVTIYILVGYFPTSLESQFHMSSNQSMLICCIGLLCLIFFVLLVGWLAQKYKHYTLFIIGPLSFLIFGHIIFDFLLSGHFVFILLAVCMTALFTAPIAATLILLLLELFPAHLRCLGISTGYNLSMSLFGGTTPFICLWLVNYFHTERAPLLCIYVCSILTLFALLLLRLKLIKHGHEVME